MVNLKEREYLGVIGIGNIKTVALEVREPYSVHGLSWCINMLRNLRIP
jgi:hypothetical protein